ncbi:MAG: MFS transporter, partial [Dehalococcoidia bacterium]
MSILPRNRPFHGWIIVFALSIAGGFSMSMAIGNVGLFVDPMGEELGIGRSAFGWAHTARLVGFAVSGPVIGLLLDRYGARVMLATAAVLFGLATATLGLASSAWQIIGLFLFMGLLGFWGSSTLYFTVPVAKWFIRQRGKAMSIVFVGVPIGVGISAPVAQLLIDAMGWRGALMVLGLTGSVVIATLSLTAVRNRPEDMGLRPDGDAALVAGQTAGGEGEDRKERSWTTKDAIRTGAFWRLAIAFGTMMLSMSAMTLFWVPYYSSIGFPVHLAALGFSMQGFTQVLASILLSKLMDHVQPRYLALAGF